MGNMRFKVGDRVRIKSLDWYNENKDKKGNVYFEGGEVKPCFSHCMSIYCGQIMTISGAIGQLYDMIEDDGRFCWVDEMIESLVEEETKPKHEDEVNGTEEKIWIYQMGQIIHCPNGYIFKDENGNIINATKIVLEKKKKEYPKTYAECCKVLKKNSDIVPEIRMVSPEESLLFSKLIKLKICRDAYWKIAGDEMGLGKPWEPDWKSLDPQYIILYQYGGIDKAETHGEGNYILTFPTAEMRDAFKENFDPDIEICKELL